MVREAECESTAPSLFIYAGRQQMDVRAYVELSADLAASRDRLENFPTQTADMKLRLTKQVMQICWNAGVSPSTCRRDIDGEIRTRGHPAAAFERYLPGARNLYESHFRLGDRRRDIRWSADSPNQAVIPFIAPEGSEVSEWLAANIEDEWQWKSWKLRLDFRRDDAGNAPYVRFVPGTTANVNGLGGNRITLDANRPLHHYTTRWTIRHEFGHVLGFPDCYIEFYDSDAGTLVNYQLDVSNLMCSRRGKLKEIHFEEMMRAYFPALVFQERAR